MTLQFDLDFPWKYGYNNAVILLNISFWSLHRDRELGVNRDDERDRKTGAEKSGSGTSDIFVNICVP